MFFKASKTSSYLYRRKNSSSFYFRRAIPVRLRNVFSKREVVLSLHTDNKTKAILLHDKLTATVNMIFLSAKESDDMDDIFKNIKKLEFNSFKKNPDGSIEVTGLKTDPKNTESDLKFLQAFGLAPSTNSLQTEINNLQKNKKTGMKFSELAVKYLSFAKQSPKTNRQDKAIFQVFTELYDDPFLSEINHVMLTNFIETVQNNIPTNAKKSYPKLTAKQIVKLNHNGKKMMSPHSINKYLGRVGMAFKYAVNHGHITENFAAGKRVKDPEKARDKRRPFTAAELKKMFETTTLYSKTYDKCSKQDLFWLNLICVYTGMRLGEICQLETIDIRKENDIFVFDINDNDDEGLKSCKTAGSVRLVPIHSELIKLGFLDFVKSRRSQKRLLNWEYHEEQGWSYESSKKANTFIQETTGIEEQKFHCFRHTVEDILMKNRHVKKELQEATTGHAMKGESYGRYGKGFSIEELKDTVEAIQYDLNLSHLYI